MDHSLYEQLDAEYQTAGLRMGEEICRIQNGIRRQVLANEHKEALLALFPDLRPITPPSTPQHEQPHEDAPGAVASDWEKGASAISKGLSGVAPKMQSVKKQDPPKFSGKISDYPRWRKNWKEIMRENNPTAVRGRSHAQQRRQRQVARRQLQNHGGSVGRP